MFSRFVLFLSVVFSVELGAQVVSTPADTGKPKKKTIKINVIDPKGKKRVEYSGQPLLLDSVQKAVKVDPVLFARGEVSVFFEWRLSRHLSAEGGLGITYMDFAYEIFENNGRFFQGSDELNDVQFHTGIATRAQFRYYPSRYETAITGFYFAPTFVYRTWNMQYYVDNGLSSFPYDVKREWTEFRIQIGEQDPDPYSVLFTEWYINFGVQWRSDDKVRGSGITAEIIHRNERRLVLGAGVKIGFVL